MTDITPVHRTITPLGDPLLERTDPEDLDTLGQMLSLGAQYIDDQDEPDEAQNIATMQGVLGTLSGLVAFEARETEPTEPDDE